MRSTLTIYHPNVSKIPSSHFIHITVEYDVHLYEISNVLSDVTNRTMRFLNDTRRLVRILVLLSI